MNMIWRLFLHGEKGKTLKGLINLDEVIKIFPVLGFDKPLPKVSVAIVIMLVSHNLIHWLMTN